MARPIETRKAARQQLGQRAAAPGIQVKASPVTPSMSLPTANDSFGRSLGGAMTFLQEKGKLDKTIEGKDYKEGMLAKYQGVDVNLAESTQAFLKGYYELEGSLAANAYQAELDQAFSKAKLEGTPWEDPTDETGAPLIDPQTGEPVLGMGNQMQEIEERHMDSLPPYRSALETFAPSALKAHQAGKQDFKLHQLEVQHAEIAVKQEALISIEIDNTNRDGGSHREKLTVMQDNAAAMNFPKPEITAMYLKQAGMKAVAEGDTEWFEEFIYAKDTHGTSIMDTPLAATALQYKNKAEAVASADVNKDIAEQKAARAKYDQVMETQWVAESSQLNALKPQKIDGKWYSSKAIAVRRKEEFLTGIDPETKELYSANIGTPAAKYILKGFDDHINDTGSANITDPEVMRQLEFQMDLIGNKEEEDAWYEVVVANGSRISRADQQSLDDRHRANQKEGMNEEKRTLQSMITTERAFIDNATFRDKTVTEMGVIAPDSVRINMEMKREYQDRINAMKVDPEWKQRSFKDKMLDVRLVAKDVHSKYAEDLKTILTNLNASLNNGEGVQSIYENDPDNLR
jgi:hypothetical protein